MVDKGNARELANVATDAMSGPDTLTVQERLRIRPADRNGAVTNDELLAAQFIDGVFAIFWRVAIAGACYPIVLSWLMIAAAVIGKLIWPSSGGSVSFVIEGVFFSCTVGALMGFFWASLVSVVVALLVYTVVRSLRLRGNLVSLAAFSGGLVGYVAVLPMTLPFWSDAHHSLLESAVPLMLGPGLTTVMGQIGGALGGRSLQVQQRVTARTAAEKDNLPGRNIATGGEGDGPAGAARFQFGVWHLLVVSIWVSLLLTLIRLSGIDFSIGLMLLGGVDCLPGGNLVVRWRSGAKGWAVAGSP